MIPAFTMHNYTATCAGNGHLSILNQSDLFILAKARESDCLHKPSDNLFGRVAFKWGALP